MNRPRKGDYYRSRRDLEVKGIIWFGAPFSFGFSGLLPEGEVVHLDYDPPQWARGVHLLPVRYDHFEREFIPEETRRIEEYSEYTISLLFDDLAEAFDRVSPDDIFGAGVDS